MPTPVAINPARSGTGERIGYSIIYKTPTVFLIIVTRVQCIGALQNPECARPLGHSLITWSTQLSVGISWSSFKDQPDSSCTQQGSRARTARSEHSYTLCPLFVYTVTSSNAPRFPPLQAVQARMQTPGAVPACCSILHLCCLGKKEGKNTVSALL